MERDFCGIRALYRLCSHCSGKLLWTWNLEPLDFTNFACEYIWPSGDQCRWNRLILDVKSRGQDEAQSSRGLVARRSLYSCYTLYFRRWRYYEDCHAETEAEVALLLYIVVFLLMYLFSLLREIASPGSCSSQLAQSSLQHFHEAPLFGMLRCHRLGMNDFKRLPKAIRTPMFCFLFFFLFLLSFSSLSLCPFPENFCCSLGLLGKQELVVNL